MKKSKRVDYLSICLSWLLKISIFSVLFVFFILIGFICYKGIMYLSWDLFDWEYTSTNVSMMPAIVNTINMVLLSLMLALPLGIFGAIFLNEYGNKKSKILNLVRIASDTLVGIPNLFWL